MVCVGGRRGGGQAINQELGKNIHTLLCIRQIANKDLLYSNSEIYIIHCDNLYEKRI